MLDFHDKGHVVGVQLVHVDDSIAQRLQMANFHLAQPGQPVMRARVVPPGMVHDHGAAKVQHTITN